MDLAASIAEFQRHVGAPAPTWPGRPTEAVELYKKTAEILREHSLIFKQFYKLNNDNSALRMELMLEELAEVFEGMVDGNEEKVLDGLVDSAYVVIGTAVSFDLPFNEAFAEVHRSNMTKSSAAASHSGNKGKGPGFIPADIKKVLTKHRKT